MIPHPGYLLPFLFSSVRRPSITLCAWLQETLNRARSFVFFLFRSEYNGGIAVGSNPVTFFLKVSPLSLQYLRIVRNEAGLYKTLRSSLK